MLLRRHKLAQMEKQAAVKPSADSVSKASKTKKDTKAATDKGKKGGAKSGSNDD